jgi:hypothetical protein
VANIAKVFGGLLLLASGLTIIYESSYRHLIEIFTIFGVILAIIGVYLLFSSFFEKDGTTNLKDFQKNLKKSKSNKLEGDLRSTNLKNRNETLGDSNKNGKANIATELGNNIVNTKLGSIDTKKITEKVKDVSKSKDPKAVLKPRKIKSNDNNKKFMFTPNYEKPMRVIRRPQKKNKSNLNSNNNGNNHPIDLKDLGEGKSEAIARALASDDFIKPIHSNHKLDYVSPSDSSSPNTSPSTSDSNKSDLIKVDQGVKRHDALVDRLQNDDMHPNVENSENKLSTFLKSYVVCSKGTMTSKEAFEELAKNAKEEIFLEMSSIKDMSDEFLSKISSLDVRIIIEDFDLKDMSYVLLITSLLEQGIKIRTLPLINTINLIADNSHALIISENDSLNELDIGAVYSDSKSISHIKSMFEKSWNISNDLDIVNLK